MSRSLIDARTDAALTALDPARDAKVDPTHYESTLARLLADDPTALGRVQPAAAPGPRRVRRRLVVLSTCILAAVSGTAIVMSGQLAYAGWGPVPTALSAADEVKATRSCLAHQGAPVIPATDTLIADRRGRWVYVLVKTSPEKETSCVMPEALVGTTPSRTDSRMYAGGSGEALTGSIAPRGIDVSTSSASATREGLFMLIEGQVGSEVERVTVLTPTGMRVTASVHNRRFAAWWPAGKSSPRNRELTGASVLEVEMTDGAVVTMPG